MASSVSKYDVFLSSSGTDTDDFSYLLYKELQSKGILTLKDDQEDEEGDTKTTSCLELAIKESRFCIVILSPTYASSPRRLEQLSQICEKGVPILPVFHLINPSEVRKQTGSWGECFLKHEQEFKEDLNKVYRWREVLKKVTDLSGWISDQNRDVTEIIKEIVKYVLSRKEDSTWIEEKNKIIEQPAAAEVVAHISDDNVEEEISIGVNERIDDHKERKSKTDASVGWNFLFTTLFLELVSAGFDQASSPSKPHYALIGMLLAIAAVLTCIWELIHKDSLVVKRLQKLQCIYYLHASNTFFDSLPDNYGLVSSICQCVFSTVQYIYFSHNANNPIRLSVLPAIFHMCLAGSMLYRNHK